MGAGGQAQYERKCGPKLMVVSIETTLFSIFFGEREISGALKENFAKGTTDPCVDNFDK